MGEKEGEQRQSPGLGGGGFYTRNGKNRFAENSMTLDNPVITASQGRPTREGSVLASPAQATLFMTSVHSDMWQQLARRGRGMATPSGGGGWRAMAWAGSTARPSPQLPSLNPAKAGSYPLPHAVVQSLQLGWVTGKGIKPGTADAYTLPREPARISLQAGFGLVNGRRN